MTPKLIEWDDFDSSILKAGMEINVVLGRVRPETLELVFRPIKGTDIFLQAPENIRWPQLLVKLGCFSSTSQARKNGWDKDIETNFNWEEIHIGKRRPITIWTFREIPEEEYAPAAARRLV